MIGGILASGAYLNFDSAINSLQQAGVFSYLIPFLIIFALVFGVLTKTQIFKDNKAIYAIISLAVALMALQFDIVPKFFSDIFPKVGVGLAVILTFMILFGLFLPKGKNNHGINALLFVVGIAIVVVVFVSTFQGAGDTAVVFLQRNWPLLVGIGIAVLVVVLVMGFQKPQEKRQFVWPQPMLVPDSE